MATADWDTFAAVLRATREAMGFPSARAFYMQAGGRKFFGATYRQYLNVESGISGPGAQLVERMALALRLSTDKARARAFFRSYLLCLVASESLLDVIMAAMGETPASPGGSPLKKALARQSSEREEFLTREQADAAEASPEAFWSWFLVLADNKPRTPEELAAACGLKPAAVANALKALEKAKLVAREKDGRYRAPHLGKVVRFPRDEHFDLRRRLTYEHAEKVAAGREKVLFRYYTLMRAPEKEVLGYAPHLVEAIEGANVCATNEKGSDTAVTLIEATVRRLFPY
jgi:DNA-binding transcriptional ArsR family regulator